MSQLTIFHTNDLHNRRGVFSLLKRVCRDENTIFLDGGDALGGSNTLFYFREPVISLMNEVGYTAMAMGNREFHYLRVVLRHRFKNARFPILSANVKDLTGRTSSCWKDYILVKIGGLTVGITGLSPVQFPERSFLTRLTGFLFLTPDEAMKTLLKSLKETHVDLLIVLSHLGVREDERLAAAFDDIDLIIGGHSHTLLREPLKIKETYIVQTGCFGRYAGRIALTCGNGGIRTLEYELIPASERMKHVG